MHTSVLRFYLFIYFSLFNSLSDLRKSNRRISLGQTRKVLYATRATRENQKHEISQRIQVKIQKNPNFSFSQIYGVLLVSLFQTYSQSYSTRRELRVGTEITGFRHVK